MQIQQQYPDLLLEEAKIAHNRGQLVDADVTATANVASCGDEATIYLKFAPHDESTDKTDWQIEQMTWESAGCIISTAGLSALSTVVVGKSVVEVARWSVHDVAKLIGLDSIAPAREQCLGLGLRALQRALTELQSP